MKHYKQSAKPSKPGGPVTWRTRKDPFENVQDNIYLQLEMQPNKAVKAILDELIQAT